MQNLNITGGRVLLRDGTVAATDITLQDGNRNSQRSTRLRTSARRNNWRISSTAAASPTSSSTP